MTGITTEWRQSPYHLALPIGMWNIYYQISMAGLGNGGNTTFIMSALSLATIPISRSYDYKNSNNGYSTNKNCSGILKGNANVSIDDKANVYILAKYANTNGNAGITSYDNNIPTEIIATCAYL